MRRHGQIVHREGLQALVVENRHRYRRVWERHESVQAFLRDYFTDEWERVQRCRYGWKPHESLDYPGDWKLTPVSCWRIPYCIPCTQAWDRHKTWAALERFSRVTPAGEPLRFQHAVLTAPLTTGGEGWGWEASRDVGRFATVVQRVLREMFGPGIGGLMSYQDFGERGFAKRHPHYDLTLNGRVLVDREVRRLPFFDLENGGRARVDAWTVQYARTFRLDARRGNVWLGRAKEGHRLYYPELKYQLREMIDLTKLTYDAAGGWVEWADYHGNRRTRMSVDAWLAGFDEYRRRLGQFMPERSERLELTRAWGHMAKGALRKSKAAFGGGPLPHGRDCRCGECESWQRRYDEDLDFLASGRPLLDLEST